jgi:hypothetical protein
MHQKGAKIRPAVEPEISGGNSIAATATRRA